LFPIPYGIVPNAILAEPTAVTVPKFGVIEGTDHNLNALAAFYKKTITVCNNIIFVSPDVYCGIPDNPIEGVGNVYTAQIESADVSVMFENRAPETVYPYPDMFNAPNRCRYIKNSAPNYSDTPLYACLAPTDIAVRIDPQGNTVIWAPSTNKAAETAEACTVAVLCIIAIALILELSKHITGSTKSGRPGNVDLVKDGQLTHWTRIIVADIIVAALWLITAYVATDGPAHLVHPAISLPSNTVAALGALKYIAISIHAATAVQILLDLHLESLDHTHAVTLRYSAETALLASIVVLTPINVAPAFHALFDATVGSVIVYITGRDAIAANAMTTALITTAAFSITSAPILVISNAVPAGTEIYVAAALTLQMLAAGILAAL
jgi:hypothetical protein